MTAVGLIDSLMMVLHYEKMGKLMLDKLTAAEEMFREDYSIPHPVSWVMVGFAVIMLLWTLNKLRSALCRGKKKEQPIFNRIDVDDISALFKTIKQV